MEASRKDEEWKPGRQPFRVRCKTHGLVELTDDEYDAQLSRPDDRWRCTVCGEEASWDDAWYEGYVDHVSVLIDAGFDGTEYGGDGSVHVKCTQCEATCVNGVACHEHGCRNQRRTR